MSSHHGGGADVGGHGMGGHHMRRAEIIGALLNGFFLLGMARLASQPRISGGD